MFDSAIFDFTDAEIREAAAANRLLSIEIEFNRLCNYRGPYCNAGDPETELPEMSSELADSVILQAAELGARKVVILGGEPLLYPELERKIELVNSLGMGAEIFTNGALLDGHVAGRSRDASGDSLSMVFSLIKSNKSIVLLLHCIQYHSRQTHVVKLPETHQS